MPCPSGEVYKECGSACQRTCGSSNAPCTDSQCVDGCFCPDGTVMMNGTCIQPSQCSCERGTDIYPPGGTVKDKCNTWWVYSIKLKAVLSSLKQCVGGLSLYNIIKTCIWYRYGYTPGNILVT
jgi:hypothetical protein